MHLIDCSDLDKLHLVERFGDDIPPYAALSHTWCADTVDEPTYQDLVEHTGENKPGYQKIRFCTAQARQDGLAYVWVDTCCIDKTNMVELSEAINSMFDWYRNSVRCYVYLSDVPTVFSELCRAESNAAPARPWCYEKAFRASLWFTRGWTLQELIAPACVQFFSADGSLIGSKKSLERLISETTGINERALRGDPLWTFEVDARFAWAACRNTKRPEDQAYSLFGIFGVRMTPHYGEGPETAFSRLRTKIKKSQDMLNNQDVSGMLSEPPVKMSRSQYLGLRARYRWSYTSDYYQWSCCEKFDVENGTEYRGGYHSGDGVNFLPLDFQRRYHKSVTTIQSMPDFHQWRIVYWQEHRVLPWTEDIERRMDSICSKKSFAELSEFGKAVTTISTLPVTLPMLVPALLRDYLLETPRYEIEFILRKRERP